MRNFKLITAACAMVASALILPTSASATAIVQSLSVDINPAITTTGFDRVAGSSYNQFNPALGTLTSIDVSLTGSIQFTGTSSSPDLIPSAEVNHAGWSKTGGTFPAACSAYGLCNESFAFSDTTPG